MIWNNISEAVKLRSSTTALVYSSEFSGRSVYLASGGGVPGIVKKLSNQMGWTGNPMAAMNSALRLDSSFFLVVVEPDGVLQIYSKSPKIKISSKEIEKWNHLWSPRSSAPAEWYNETEMKNGSVGDFVSGFEDAEPVIRNIESPATQNDSESEEEELDFVKPANWDKMTVKQRMAYEMGQPLSPRQRKDLGMRPLGDDILVK